MNSSQILGGTNEFSGNSGNESGWTYYIDSTIHENSHDDYEYIDSTIQENSQAADADDDDDTGVVDDSRFLSRGKHNQQKDGYGKSDADECESNDSMMSDASSGPSHCEVIMQLKQKLPPATSSHHRKYKKSSKRQAAQASKAKSWSNKDQGSKGRTPTHIQHYY